MANKFDESFSNCSVPKALSNNEVKKLFIKYNSGDKSAKDILVSHNIRLVFFEVRNKFYNTQMDTEDLVSIGLIGLLKAVNSYDVTKNFKFATYAVRCIDNEILMNLRKNNLKPNLLSLNDPVYCSGDRADNNLLIDEIISGDSDLVEDIVEDYDIKRRVGQVVSNLSEKDNMIISYYFGFNGCKRLKQSEIAAMLGIGQSYLSRMIRRILVDIKKELEAENEKVSIYDKRQKRKTT